MLQVTDKVKNFVVQVDGGIGKVITATAVIRAIKKAHPKLNIITMSGCPEIFMNNPNVKRSFHFQNALNFYEDWINDTSVVLKAEPYLHYDYIQKTKHVVECWCEQIGIPFDGVEPDIYFIPNELEAAKIFADELTSNGKSDLVLFQWIGGQVPENTEAKTVKMKLAGMYRRAMPISQAQSIVDYFYNERGSTVINVGHQNFPQLKNCKNPQLPIRAVISLLTQAKLFVGIDSFLQHAAAANQIKNKGVVVWGGTSKICLGYDWHKNLEVTACPTPACHRPNSYLMDIQMNGQMWDCPYGEPCMKRTTDEIITAINEVSLFDGVKGIVSEIKEESRCKG